MSRPEQLYAKDTLTFDIDDYLLRQAVELKQHLSLVVTAHDKSLISGELVWKSRNSGCCAGCTCADG